MNGLTWAFAQGAAMVVIPLALWGWAPRRFGLGRLGWAAIGYGCLFFLLAFVVDRALRIVALVAGASEGTGGSLLFALIGALASEMTRFGVFRNVGQIHESLDRRVAVAYGLGHGGFESLTLGLFRLAEARLVQVGGETLPPETIGAIMGTPPYVFGLGVVERLIWIALHVGLSMVVARAVLGRSLNHLALAILLNAAAVFGALMVRDLVGGPLPVLLWLGLLTGVAIAYGAARPSSSAEATGRS